MKKDRIAITGYGFVGPNMKDTVDFLDVLTNGKRVLGYNPNYSELASVFGMVNDNFEMNDNKFFKRLSLVSKLALLASIEAVQMAGVHLINKKRIGVIIGTSGGGMSEIETHSELSQKSAKRFPLLGVSNMNSHSISTSISSYFGFEGPSFVVCSSCTSSLDTILLAESMLKNDMFDVCIVGGADAMINRTSVLSFLKTKTLSQKSTIEESGIPFHKPSTGYVMSDGAGIFVIEKEGFAKSRNAEIQGIIEGISSNNDAISTFQSDDTGESMINCLKPLLFNGDITYINSQALGIKENDDVESTIHQTLYPSVPITSIKGNIGHMLGASGASQLVSVLLSMKYNFIPKTLTDGIGYEELPIVKEYTPKRVERVIITSHGYGGNNLCLSVASK